jgi:hypothetical protein
MTRAQIAHDFATPPETKDKMSALWRVHLCADTPIGPPEGSCHREAGSALGGRMVELPKGPSPQRRRSAAGSIASPPRSRHEARDPRCNGLPGGALAPSQARPRRASAAVARFLQSGGRRRTSAANCCCELSHTGCRRSLSAASARSGSVSSVN